MFPFVDKPGFAGTEEARIRMLKGESFPLPALTVGNEDLANIILIASAFKPKNRYESAASMKADLQLIHK